MKKLVFIFFIGLGLFTSCVKNPEENPDPLAPAGNLTANFDDQTFESDSTTVVIDAVSMSIKAKQLDGSYFKITLPENPIVGTYSWSEGFTLQYNKGDGTDSYVAAKDNVGVFAPFPNYTDTAVLVIVAIDKTNKRISGTFKFTGVRFTDDTQTAVETKVFTNGEFLNLPYTSTAIVEPVDENSILPKKIVYSYPGSGIANQSDVYTYDGKKVLTETYTDSEGIIDKTYYTYNTRDLIIKKEDKVDNVIEYTETFEYDGISDKLITYISSDIFAETAVKETYEHNSNGSITVTRFTGDLTTQDTPDGTSTITFVDGEIARISFSLGESYNYTYDSKNNPFKNVLGFDKISFVDGEPTGILRNGLTKTSNSSPIPIYSFTYTYDDFTNFPTTGTTTGVLTTITYQ